MTSKSDQTRIIVGFLTRYLSMHKSIAELIANQKPEKIRIIGHSMGGALAILAAIEFKAMNQSEDRKLTCFTLAAPIIGDQRFSKLFDEANIEITRLARADDFLPKLAPISPYDGYGEGMGFVNFGLYSRGWHACSWKGQLERS